MKMRTIFARVRITYILLNVALNSIKSCSTDTKITTRTIDASPTIVTRVVRTSAGSSFAVTSKKSKIAFTSVILITTLKRIKNNYILLKTPYMLQ